MISAARRCDIVFSLRLRLYWVSQRRPEGLAAGGADLQGDLVGGAADTAGLDFEAGHDVFHRLLEHLKRIVAGLFLHDVERIVNDLLRNALSCHPA